ncbi:MAG: cytochrome b [Hyphomicrobiales bacterium]|nr:cytochrome b [Hyphomicrobiales bacterium]MDE2115207.1 cytochrome b [Hyphomicrobiales bacterium]
MPQRYGSAAKWLHWIMAALILAQIPAGVALNRVAPGPTQNRLYGLHEEFGFLLLLLAILRLTVRWRQGAPAPSASLTAFERHASIWTHRALYFLIVAMPILGWLAISAYGARIDFFGIGSLPSLLPKNEPLSKVLFTLHTIGGFAMAALLLLHIGATFYHVLIRHDDVLARILPQKRQA